MLVSKIDNRVCTRLTCFLNRIFVIWSRDLSELIQLEISILEGLWFRQLQFHNLFIYNIKYYDSFFIKNISILNIYET